MRADPGTTSASFQKLSDRPPETNKSTAFHRQRQTRFAVFRDPRRRRETPRPISARYPIARARCLAPHPPEYGQSRRPTDTKPMPPCLSGPASPVSFRSGLQSPACPTVLCVCHSGPEIRPRNHATPASVQTPIAPAVDPARSPFSLSTCPTYRAPRGSRPSPFSSEKTQCAALRPASGKPFHRGPAPRSRPPSCLDKS